MMTARIEQWTAQVEARGKVEGTLVILRRWVARGTLRIDEARAEVEGYLREGYLSRAEADGILARLG